MIDQEGIKIETKFLDDDGQIALVELSGYVDQANVHLLQKTIDNSLESGTFKLIFDLKDLVYMSSAGWGVLIGEIKRFRENGGDIKLVNMSPEIYEVYQMLEFYHILSEYPSVEEALASFTHGQEATNVKPPVAQVDESHQIQEDLPEPQQEVETSTTEINDILEQIGGSNNNNQHEEPEIIEEDIDIELEDVVEKDLNIGGDTRDKVHVEFNPVTVERPPDFKILPLPEKVRAIVAQFPHFGPWKIRKMLRHPEFGNVKIGYFKLRRLLKQLELDTKEKRYRYYRSC